MVANQLVGLTVTYPDTGVQFTIYWDTHRSRYGLKPLNHRLPKDWFIPYIPETYTLEELDNGC